MAFDDEDAKGARDEKKGLAEYVGSHLSCINRALIVTLRARQGAPGSDFVPGPPTYSSTRDASTSSAVVVASSSGHTLPVEPPPSGVPTNGLNIFTVIEPIRGLWGCQARCGAHNLNSTRSLLGSWLLDPLAPPSSGTSILQTIVQHRAGRRPRRFRNMTLGTATAKLDSRHGNISAALRVVGESAITATATIRTTTRSGNIVLELVS